MMQINNSRSDLQKQRDELIRMEDLINELTQLFERQYMRQDLYTHSDFRLIAKSMVCIDYHVKIAQQMIGKHIEAQSQIDD